MRQNLGGTEAFGTCPQTQRSIFLGGQVESLDTEVLSDPAFMLLLSRRGEKVPQPKREGNRVGG